MRKTLLIILLAVNLFAQTKLFEWNGVEGTLIETVSKTPGTYTVGTADGFVESDNGITLDFDNADTKLDSNVPYTNLPLTGNITVEAWIKARGWGEGGFGRIIDNGNIRLMLNVGGNNIRFTRDGSTISPSAGNGIFLGCYHHVVVTSTSAGVTNIYIDNAISGTVDQASGTPVAGTTNIIIGNRNASDRTFNGNIARVIVYDGILTSTERGREYSRYLASSNQLKEKFYNLNAVNKPTDLSYEFGLVAAYSMKPVNGTLVDISGNGYNATQTVPGSVSTLEGIKFNNASYYDANHKPAANGSLLIRFKAHLTAGGAYLYGSKKTNDRMYLGIDATAKFGGGIAAQGIPTIKSTTTLLEGKEYVGAITWNGTTVELWLNGSKEYSAAQSGVISNTTRNNFLGALNNDGVVTIPTKCEIMDVREYSTKLTDQQIKDYHNSFINPVLIEGFKDAGADEIVKIPREWQNGTTTAKIKEVTTYVNKDIDIGRKYLEFQGAGTMTIHVDSDSYVGNGYISYYYFNGSTWAQRTGLVNAPVTGVSYANKTLTFTGVQAGDRITNIKILNGVKQSISWIIYLIPLIRIEEYEEKFMRLAA